MPYPVKGISAPDLYCATLALLESVSADAPRAIPGAIIKELITSVQMRHEEAQARRARLAALRHSRRGGHNIVQA